jgi:transposase
MNKIPIGSKYLIKKNLDELIKLYRFEKNTKAHIRLLCAIHRKKGKTIKQISEILEIPRSTISDYLHRLDKNLDLIYDNNCQSRPSKLNKKLQEQIVKILKDNPEKYGYTSLIWTTKMIKHYIQHNFNIKFTSQGIRKMLYRLGIKNYEVNNLIIKNTKKKFNNLRKIDKSIVHIYNIDKRSTYWK